MYRSKLGSLCSALVLLAGCQTSQDGQDGQDGNGVTAPPQGHVVIDFESDGAGAPLAAGASDRFDALGVRFSLVGADVDPDAAPVIAEAGDLVAANAGPMRERMAALGKVLTDGGQGADYRIDIASPVNALSLTTVGWTTCLGDAPAGEPVTLALHAYDAGGSLIASDAQVVGGLDIPAESAGTGVLTVRGAGIARVETSGAQGCAVAIAAVAFTRESDLPVAQAGADQTATCLAPDALASFTLDGTASRGPAGSTIEYRWMADGRELASGASPTVTLAPGLHNISLLVTGDGATSMPDQVQILVQADQAPAVSLQGTNPTLVECGETYVDLGATAADACSGDLTASLAATGAVDTTTPGRYEATYRVTDPAGQEASATRSVVVRDSTAPQVEVGEMLQFYPPDYEYLRLSLSDCARALDTCGGTLDIDQMGHIVSIYSDEPEVLHSDDPPHDIVLQDHSTFLVRNQRDSYGNGRVYGIEFYVADESGNRSDTYTCHVGIKVFDDGGCYDIPVDDGPDHVEDYLCDDPAAPPALDPNPACEAAPEVGTFEPTREWHIGAWSEYSAYNQIMAAPVVASLNDDNGDGVVDENDIPDILATFFQRGRYSSPGVLRAVSGDGSRVHFSVPGVAGAGGIAAGDIDGDGLVEIVTVRVDGVPVAFENDGTYKWAGPVGAGSRYAAPVIADMDGDGSPEIVVRGTIYNADGSLRGHGIHGGGYHSSAVADLDGDGVQEVITGNAVYGPNGATIWYNHKSDGFVGIADFDGDEEPEIVVSGSSRVRLQDRLGAVRWDVVLPGGGTGGPPTVADFDGDGAPEIGVAGRGQYVVFEGDGSILWQRNTRDYSSSVTGSSVYDFEGDGVADVVYADEINLWVYSGVDGAVKLQWTRHGSGTIIEYPLVVDVDADDQAEIVLISNNYAFGSTTGISVIGDARQSWKPARRIWNQHAYSITNVNDDGTIPAQPVANWARYNNFRSGDLSPADGAAVPDLVVHGALCDTECPAGTQVVWAHVGNTGASPLTGGATIELYGQTGSTRTLLDSVPWRHELAAGTSGQAVALRVPAASYEAYVLHVSAGEAECNTDNNERVIAAEAGVCLPR